MQNHTKINIIVLQGTEAYSRAALQALCSAVSSHDKRQTSNPNASCTVSAGTESSFARSSGEVFRA